MIRSLAVRPLARTLPFALPVLLAGCSTADGYPSLDVRPAEVALRARPAPSASEAPPQLPSPGTDLTTRLKSLLALAQSADATFEQKLPAARKTIAAAGPAASDSWSRAQVSLSELQSSRSSAMSALAELDELYVAARDEAPTDLSPKAQAIATTRDQVSAIITAQDKVLAQLGAGLGA